jgi:DNA-binding NtrC family response regulator
MKDSFDALINHFLDSHILMSEGIELLERRMIERALERCAGRQTATSKLLGIHRNTLQRKMTEYQLIAGRPRARRKPPISATRPPGRKKGAA